MKVCIFLPSLAGGGAEGSMLRIATALADRGHEIDLVTARDEQAANHRPGPQVRYETLGKAHTRSAVRDLAQLLRARRPDVMCTAMDHANAAGLLAAGWSRTGTPVVVTFRNDVAAASRRSGRAFSYIRPQLARLALWRADHVIAVSDGVRAGLDRLAHGSGSKITRVYNPTVRDRLFELASAPADGAEADAEGDLAVTVLAVGRLSEQKGFDALIRAFAEVAPKHPAARLLILGEGPQRSELEDLARRLGVADRVALPGYATNPYRAMSRCRVFAFSSRWEGLGNVLVEAGALGCTIVATDCPSGPRELLADRPQATLVPVDDVPTFATALDRAVEAPPRRWDADWSEHTVAAAADGYERVLLDTITEARR
jgi:glycosyltransferase involved in cell wall biosynthesis